MGMLKFTKDEKEELKAHYEKLQEEGATNFRIFPHRDGSKTLLFKPAPTATALHGSIGDATNPLDR